MIYKEKHLQKFEEVYDVIDWQVETPDGFEDIEKVCKTIPYEVWELELENGMKLYGADEHIVYRFEQEPYYINNVLINYSDYNEVFLKDIKLNDFILIRSANYCSQVKSIKNLGYKENMFDLQISGKYHQYYSNGIISHNTALLSNFAIDDCMNGKNVVYITLEVSEEELNQRIESCILDVPIYEMIIFRDKEEYFKRWSKYKDDMPKWGTLQIKEFPSGGTNVNHLKNYLKQLKLKMKLEPDILYVDYAQLLMSSRSKSSVSDSYTHLKLVTEELVGLAKNMNLPIVTPHQFNREGNENDEVKLGYVAESFAIPNYADLVVGIVVNKEMIKKENQQLLCTVLKTRYSANRYEKFVIGFDKKFMKIYDVKPNEINESEFEKIKETLKNFKGVIDEKEE